jgi:TP901 family phage tail tape measure protein
MSNNSAEFILKFQDMVSGGMTKIEGVAGSLTKKIDSLGASFTKTGINSLVLNQVAQNVQMVNSAIQDIVRPGREFENSMAEVQAITSVTDAELAKLTTQARELATTFGEDAAKEGSVFIRWLSDVSPELAKNADAMKALGTTTNLMAKIMKGDIEGASTALTTMNNQFGTNSDNPLEVAVAAARNADILTKAAQIGSAEVSDLAQSVKVAGNTAYNAGLDLTQTAAALEVLGKGSIKGAEAGVGLRNVLGEMSKGAQYMEEQVKSGLLAAGVSIEKLSDKTIPFKDRLKELSKIQGDSALIGKMFGKENQNAALQLLKNIPLLEQYESQMQNSAGATAEMAAILMSTGDERMNRLTAKIKDLGISIYNTIKEGLPVVQFLAGAADLGSRIAPAFTLAGRGFTRFVGLFKKGEDGADSFIKKMAMMGLNAVVNAGRFVFTAVVGLGSFIASMATATLGMSGFNVAMYANPIGLFVLGLMAVVAAVALVIAYWDDIVIAISSFGEWIAENNPLTGMLDAVLSIMPGWVNDLMKWFVDIGSKVLGWVKNIAGRIKDLFNLDIDLSKLSITGLDDGLLGVNTKDDDTKNKTNGKKPLDTKIPGESKARISVVRIGTIQVNNTFTGGSDEFRQNAKTIGDQVVNEILAAIYDMQKVLITT